MSGSPTLLPESRLGSTLRRDPWWMEILPVAVVLGGFGVYNTLRAFENAYYFWGPYLSPFYSPLIDPQHRWWPFSPARWAFALPATTTAKRTTARFSSIPPRAPSVSLLAGIISAKRLFPSSFKMSIATSSTLLFSLSRFFGTTPSVLFSSMAASAWVSAHLSSLSTSHFFLSTRFPAIRSVILPAASLIASLARTSAGLASLPGASPHF